MSGKRGVKANNKGSVAKPETALRTVNGLTGINTMKLRDDTLGIILTGRPGRCNTNGHYTLGAPPILLKSLQLLADFKIR